jgi:hypothetical protein
MVERQKDSWENPTAFLALKQLQSNPRVKYIVIAAPNDACHLCLSLVGTYPKDQVPRLPYESCSLPHGCRAFYMPFIEEVYP